MRVDQARQQRLFAKIDNVSSIALFDCVEGSNIDNLFAFNRNGAVLDWCAIHRHDDSCADNHSPFTTFRHSATSRLHASWQSNGIEVSLRPVWSCDASNFSFGNFVDAIAPRWSRFHRIVRKQPLSDRQNPATKSSICSSEIFTATRYIPDCRSNVSRSGEV